MKKKIIIIAVIVLLLTAGGILTSLYILGDKIIDEAIDMSIPTLSEIQPETAQASAAPTPSVPSESAPSQPAAESTKVAAPAESSAKQPPAVTVEKMKEIKEEVTATDKIEAATMVMSKLSTSEIDKLKGMLSGGLTAEEKAEAKKIAFANFTSEEIAKIKEMYTKYMNNK